MAFVLITSRMARVGPAVALRDNARAGTYAVFAEENGATYGCVLFVVEG
jgi:hypothetical protein